VTAARDLINSSFRLIGILGEGESPSAQQSNDALITLNALIDSFSNESLMIYTKAREQFNLVAGQQIFTFGTGGDFNSTRPQMIENALIIAPQNSPNPELQMQILNKDQYASIILKSTTSTIPLYLYNDTAYPLSNIYLWPVPQIITPIVFFSWKPLTTLSTLDTVISLPPGYERMLRFNLAVDLGPEYGVQPREDVIAIAMQSKAAVKRMNNKPLFLNTDPMLSDQRTGWNWRTGDYI
jgi:hypothetical protein